MAKLLIPLQPYLDGRAPVTKRFGEPIPVEFDGRVVGFATYVPSDRRPDGEEFTFSYDTDDPEAVAAHLAHGSYEPILVPSKERTWALRITKIILLKI